MIAVHNKLKLFVMKKDGTGEKKEGKKEKERGKRGWEM